MYISSMQLEGLRCFEKCKINFSRNINIIIGANNSGKSSIIKAIYGLQDENYQRINDIRVNKFKTEILIGLKTETITDYFNIAKYIVEATLIPEFSLYIQINNETTEKKLLVNFPVYKRFVDFSNIYNYENKYDFGKMPNSEELGNFIYPFFAKRKTTHYNVNKAKDAAFNVLDTFSNLPAKIKKASSHPNYKHEFKRLCLDILGFEIEGTIPGDNAEDKIGIYAGGATKTITIESMGEGVANIVGLITILLTEDSKVYLIEELENDLHPTALKKLLNLIIEKSNKNQFIISTHSNIVLKYLGSLDTTKIFFTESSMNEDYIPTSTIEEIENTPQERIKVLEQLGYDLMDYELYKAYLILEEYTSERIIKQIIIPDFVPSLKEKLRTIAAQGVSDLEPKFNDFYKLFLYLHLGKVYDGKAWVIADGDEPGKEAINKLANKFKSWDAKHFSTFSKEDFEQYYPERFKNEVDDVLKMPHGKNKQNAKAELLKKVEEWYFLNKSTAKAEFEISAKEVIEKLKEIASFI